MKKRNIKTDLDKSGYIYYKTKAGAVKALLNLAKKLEAEGYIIKWWKHTKYKFDYTNEQGHIIKTHSVLELTCSQHKGYNFVLG